MAAATKITLSDKELELVCNTGWILTKHTIIQKVYALYGETLPSLKNVLEEKRNILPPEVFNYSPKISKGENYKLLPWVMLDYPRCFGKDDVMAVRIFFWWGNFFSVNLQLSGIYKAKALPALQHRFEWLKNEGYFICVGDGPWEHHFDETNFVSASKLTEQQFAILLEKPFLKIAKKIPLEEWNRVPRFINCVFNEITDLLTTNQAPSR